MNTLNKVELRAQIEKQIARTERKIKGYESMSEPVGPDNAIGRVSRMDAINNKGVTEAALRQAREKLGQLRHALSQLDEAQFGICRRCSQPIPAGRILLMPESPYCVRCAR